MCAVLVTGSIRCIIFWESLRQFFLLSSQSLRVAGGPRGFHDPCPDPVQADGYEGYAVGEAGVFSEGGGREGDEGGPGGDGRLLLCGGPCRGLKLPPCGLCDHEVLDEVRVLVP